MRATLIRGFVPADAAALAALFHASVREGALAYYSPAQVAAWSPSPPDPARYVARAAARLLLVAVDEGGAPVGYGDVDAGGHIDHLYCRPDRIGTGVGSALLARLEAAARAAGAPRLTVMASEGARLLLERRGFHVERANEAVVAGVAMPNHAMAKRLG